MAVNWQDVITAVGGDAVLLGAAGWLIQALVSNRLVMEADKFKIDVKTKADTEIARVRELLTRGSRVHERQLDILTKLYRHFYDVQGYMQRMTSAGRIEGERSPEQYAALVNKAMESAHEELLLGRLLIPLELAEQCDSFFTAAFKARWDFDFAHLPMLDPKQSADFWTAAAQVAHQQIPKILRQIERTARAVIHGE
jgi:hypothetical protein